MVGRLPGRHVASPHSHRPGAELRPAYSGCPNPRGACAARYHARRSVAYRFGGRRDANERISRTRSLPAFTTNVDEVSASVGWELDFWGKFRRATEAARASLLANEWARTEVIRTV